MEICIIGGAFDPFTIGHRELGIVATKYCDEVWYVPVRNHAYGKKMATLRDREHMIQLGIQGLNKMKILDFDDGGVTINLMEKLIIKYPKYDFSFLIGQDNADTLDRWQRADDLKKLIKFLVVPRKGYNPSEPDVWYKQTPHMYLDHLIMPDCSSTVVRWLISNNDSQVTKYISEDVFHHIQEKNLYRENQ